MSQFATIMAVFAVAIVASLAVMFVLACWYTAFLIMKDIVKELRNR